MITDEKTRFYQKRLMIPEIKVNSLTNLSSGTISEIKNGHSKVTAKSETEIKVALNTLYLELIEFGKKEVVIDDKYFASFLDLTANKSINFKKIYDGILTVKPPYGKLSWSYWTSEFAKSKNLIFNGKNIIAINKDFFNQFRYEIQLLANKIKV